ncbi:CynX/NimT family MFS transporter [Chloroflexota bacterium]
MFSFKNILSSGESSTIEPQQRPYRWLILAVVCLLYAAFGLSVRSMSPVITPMLRDLNMSYGEMGFVLGTWQLVYIPVAVFAGAAIDKWGIRRSLFVGGIIMVLSVGLRYFAVGFTTLLPMVALFGIGAPLISIGAPKTVSEWFSGSNRAIAVGIYTMAPWMGGLFALAATNSVVMPLMDYSWRLTFLGYSLLVLVFAFIWGFFARDIKKNEDIVKTSLKDNFIRLMKVHNVRIVVLAGLITLFIEHGFSHWLPKLLENNGFSPETAGYMASIPLLAAIPCVLLIPRLVKRHLRGRVIGALSVLTSVALLVLITASSSGVMVIGLILYGLATPVLLPMLMLVIMDDPEVGSANMGLAGGMFFSVAEIGGFTGPLLMGVMVDVAGSFLPGVSVLAGMGLVMCALTFLLRKTEV